MRLRHGLSAFVHLLSGFDLREKEKNERKGKRKGNGGGKHFPTRNELVTALDDKKVHEVALNNPQSVRTQLKYCYKSDNIACNGRRLG